MFPLFQGFNDESTQVRNATCSLALFRGHPAPVSMSYAADLSSSLGSSLATLTPRLVSSGSSSPSSTNLAHATAQNTDQDLQEHRAITLKSTLTKLHPGHSISFDSLAQLINEAFPPAAAHDDTSHATISHPQTERVELVTLAQLAISSYGTILNRLMHQATRLGAEDDWWARVESDNWKTGFYLLQCEP